LFTCIAPAYGDEPNDLAAPNVYSGIKLEIDKPHRLVSVLAILLSEGWQDTMERIVKNPNPERKAQTVLEPVGLILGRVEFELHAAYCVNHT
jgi:hypothetical protein